MDTLRFGNEIEDLPGYNIEIKIQPAQFINNKVYINSIANLFISVLFDTENIVHNHKHTLEYVLNELITNAVKYSIKESEISVTALKIEDRVYFKIYNKCANGMMTEFTSYLTELYNSDIEVMYQNRINSLCSFIDTDILSAGIGVMTLINDYELPLSYEINKFADHEYQIITKFYLEA